MQNTNLPFNAEVVKNYIANGNLEEAIQILLPYYNDATIQMGNFKGGKKEYNRNTIDFQQWQRIRAQVTSAILDMMETNPDKTVVSSVQQPVPVTQPVTTTPSVPPATSLAPPTTIPEPPSTTSPAPPTPVPTSPVPPTQTPDATNGNVSGWAWKIGLVLLLLPAIVLFLFMKCPTANQEIAARILMSLGAGGVATLLPGMFNIDFTWLKAGSALGVFTMVYFYNPASVVKDDRNCQKLPFEYTIALMPSKQLKISAQYPKLKDAVLKIRLDNKWEPAQVNADGDADFKSIPGDFKDQIVAAQLSARYWKLELDSVKLIGKSAVMTIVPDGTLGKLTGRVTEVDGVSPIADAQVAIGNLAPNPTNANGIFNIEVPEDIQQETYSIHISKKGYDNIQEVAPANLSQMAFRLKKQRKK